MSMKEGQNLRGGGSRGPRTETTVGMDRMGDQEEEEAKAGPAACSELCGTKWNAWGGWNARERGGEKRVDGKEAINRKEKPRG